MRRVLIVFSFLFSSAAIAQEAYLTDSTLHYVDQSPSYDVYGAVRPFSDSDKTYFAEKWNPSTMISEWHEYHGHLIRVDFLTSNRDLREMRLRFMHHDSDRYIDGDISFILEQVASEVMRQTCGRMATDVLRVYDRPSAEASRPNSFYDYEIEFQGVGIREYGFRCIYSQ